MQIVLGLDPGIATTGYGLVAKDGHRLACLEYGCLLTPKDTPMHERLLSLSDQVSSLIERAQPSAIALEQLFFNRNVSTAIAVGQARGVLMLAAARTGMAVGEYAPTTIKMAVTGFGGADKAQVQSMVTTLLGLKKTPRPDDAADALAVALCHLNASPLAAALSRGT